jgi:hypothetical protein
VAGACLAQRLAKLAGLEEINQRVSIVVAVF